MDEAEGQVRTLQRVKTQGSLQSEQLTESEACHIAASGSLKRMTL